MNIQKIAINDTISFGREEGLKELGLLAMKTKSNSNSSLQPIVDRIIPSLSSTSEKEKLQAIRLLNTVASKDELPLVLHFLKKEKSMALKAPAIDFITKVGSTDNLKEVIPYLDVKLNNSQVKTASLRFIAEHGRPRHVYLVKPFLQSSSYHDKYEALRFFVHNGSRKHGRLVKSFLTDSNKNIENLALRFFEEKGSKVQKHIVSQIKSFKTPAEAVKFFLEYCVKSFK